MTIRPQKWYQLEEEDRKKEIPMDHVINFNFHELQKRLEDRILERFSLRQLPDKPVIYRQENNIGTGYTFNIPEETRLSERTLIDLMFREMQTDIIKQLLRHKYNTCAIHVRLNSERRIFFSYNLCDYNFDELDLHNLDIQMCNSVLILSKK
jgi:hypothetical protein